MRAFRIYLFREEDGALFSEAKVILNHLLPPQFERDGASRLTEHEAKELISIAARGALGERIKTDLEACEALPISPPASLLDYNNL